MAPYARKALKVLLFIGLSLVIGRSVDIYSLMSTDTAITLSHKLFNEGGQENVEAAYALIDAAAIVVMTTVVYLLVMKLIRGFISKGE